MLDYRTDIGTKMMFSILLMALSFILAEPAAAQVAAANCILLLAVILILEEQASALVASANCPYMKHWG